MTAVTRSRAGRANAATLKTKTKKKAATGRANATTLKTKTKKKAAATALVGDGIQKRKRQASASEGAQIPKAGRKTLAEASFILKLKKEAFGAIDLWEHRYVPGAMERWLKAKEKKAKAEEARPKKTEMVIKTVLSREFVDLIRMQQPGLIKDVPAEELARQTESTRQRHAMMKYINGKMYAYQQALIDQYMSQGYAEDEDEVRSPPSTDGEQD